MEHVIMGAIAMASTVAALFFLRFWRDTGDRLFFMFSLALLLLGVTSLVLALSPEELEGHTHWYRVRLAACMLILVAIVDKNRSGRSRLA